MDDVCTFNPMLGRLAWCLTRVHNESMRSQDFYWESIETLTDKFAPPGLHGLHYYNNINLQSDI